jgi:hypothetical protein
VSGGPASPRAGAPFLPSLAGLALCLAAYALLKSAFGILICDDAYITLAHARSWNAGLGPVMSAQNPVCATSTPLFTMLLAAEGAILHASLYTALAYFTNLFWDLAGLFFLYRIASRGLKLTEPFALAATAAYALSVNALAVSAYGMETPMYAALALAGTWFALYAPKPLSKPALAGFAAVCFLAPLARPEGALLPAVLVFLHWLGARKVRGRSLSGYVMHRLRIPIPPPDPGGASSRDFPTASMWPERARRSRVSPSSSPSTCMPTAISCRIPSWPSGWRSTWACWKACGPGCSTSSTKGRAWAGPP